MVFFIPWLVKQKAENNSDMMMTVYGSLQYHIDVHSATDTISYHILVAAENTTYISLQFPPWWFRRCACDRVQLALQTQNKPDMEHIRYCRRQIHHCSVVWVLHAAQWLCRVAQSWTSAASQLVERREKQLEALKQRSHD